MSSKEYQRRYRQENRERNREYMRDYMSLRRARGEQPYKRERIKAENFNPLFDPNRDAWPEQSLTAILMGDPPPGRRQLVCP